MTKSFLWRNAGENYETFWPFTGAGTQRAATLYCSPCGSEDGIGYVVMDLGWWFPFTFSFFCKGYQKKHTQLIRWTDSCQWAALTEPFGINWFVHLSAWVKTTLLCSLPTALLLLPPQTVGDCPTPAWGRPTEPTVHWSRKLRCLSYSEYHSVAAPCRGQGPDWVTLLLISIQWRFAL